MTKYKVKNKAVKVFITLGKFIIRKDKVASWSHTIIGISSHGRGNSITKADAKHLKNCYMFIRLTGIHNKSVDWNNQYPQEYIF